MTEARAEPNPPIGHRHRSHGLDEFAARGATGHRLVRSVFEQVFNQHDLDITEGLFATRYLEHALAPFGNDEPGAVDGPAHMRNVVTWLTAQFPDLHMTIESIIAQGDMVAARVLAQGTNTGRLNGVIAPTGRKFRDEQSHWYRVEHGKLVEHWATRDDLGTMIQLGILSPPGPPQQPKQTSL